jgi:hypothetical protein
MRLMREATIALVRRLRRMRLSEAVVRLGRSLPRPLLGIVATLLFTAAVVLAVASGVGDVGASIGRSLLTALVVALLAWLWFGFYTSEQSTSELRRRAESVPESLFATPPRVGAAENVIGRDALVDDLVASMDPELRTGPQLVVGDTGAGKTSLLLKLAATLAREHDRLPIVVSLRGVDKLDFHALARAQFEEYIDPHVRAQDDVDKLWRYLCRRAKVVVLADDLDRANVNPGTDPHGTAARAALEAAHRRGLALVVTSRPQGVPRNLAEPPVELGPLDLSAEDAAERVAKRAGREGDEVSVELVRKNIEAGGLTDNAFYLGVVRDLLRQRRLDEPAAGGAHAVRLALCDRTYEALLGEHTVADELKRRRRNLDAVTAFAVATLAPDRDPVAAAAEVIGAADALRAVEPAGVVYLDEDGRYQFVHDVVHAYFASRAIAGDPGTGIAVVGQAPDAPRVQLALVLAATSVPGSGFCRKVCAALLADAATYDDERRLLRAAAAAEVAVAGGFRESNKEIAAECAVARAEASPVARRAALEQLARLGGRDAVEAIWEYASDADYGVRWAAARKLVERCAEQPDAYQVLERLIESAFEPARKSLEAKAKPDDWEPVIVPLKHVAWMLPALRTVIAHSGDGDAAAAAGAQLEELLELERRGVTPQRGLEASIAQGFKLDARLRRDVAIDAEVVTRLKREETFWYSQLNLLHALTLRGANDDGDGAQAELRRFERDGAAHPFVRATARLCRRALAEAARSGDGDGHAARDAIVDRYVWDDEGVVVARQPHGLADEAMQLVGDMVVLLDMNEAGSDDARARFGAATTLPYCMQGSRDRMQCFTSCRTEECEFRLCPLGPPMDRLSARRELSRAFCRHQRLHARRRTARLWGSKVQKRALREFWRRLEALARS